MTARRAPKRPGSDRQWAERLSQRIPGKCQNGSLALPQRTRRPIAVFYRPTDIEILATKRNGPNGIQNRNNIKIQKNRHKNRNYKKTQWRRSMRWCLSTMTAYSGYGNYQHDNSIGWGLTHNGSYCFPFRLCWKAHHLVAC